MDGDKTFRIFRDPEKADFATVRVTIFRAATGRICGWLLGPSDLVADGEGYIPASAQIHASSAILRALSIAESIGRKVSVIDPEDLWSAAWGADKP